MLLHVPANEDEVVTVSELFNQGIAASLKGRCGVKAVDSRASESNSELNQVCDVDKLLAAVRIEDVF